MQTNAQTNDAYELFMGALDVSNRALEEVRDRPVVKKMVEMMEKQASGKKFGVAVYNGDASTPHDYFTVRVQNHHLQLASHGKDSPDIDWKVSMAYLRDINENPQAYIDNPLKIDFDWLKHRIQDGMS
ncbi:MAG: hypothetical protein VBE63_26130 [Lamprobacter sp.]|uniref:hypothetical protein n=1 Tax=Lamprobacter sp. TaxID=3100796 RepID=UPI002B25A8F5|nr:hypothetical protein [Lamprobacter sp.]MEA3643383.1 hypothetical protein [Lamprobacter sp.]